MNGLALFAYGLFVTVIVGVAIGLLVWGAILDGRYDREMRDRRRHDAASAGSPRAAAAAARD